MPDTRNLYEQINEAMRTDSNSTDKISLQLKDEYEQANKVEREAIDRVFIQLTGFSLRSYLDEYESDPEYNPFKRKYEELATNNDNS